MNWINKWRLAHILRKLDVAEAKEKAAVKIFQNYMTNKTISPSLEDSFIKISGEVVDLKHQLSKFKAI